MGEGKAGEGTRVAFQGEPGAYSEMAARRSLGTSVVTLPRPSFRDVFLAVQGEQAELGILPIENSTAGTISETYDRLLDSGLRIIKEVYLPIEHCLLVLPGTEPSDVKVVSSHPQALAQCRSLIEKRGFLAQAVQDTAGAARWLATEGTKKDGALASSLAAELYGLKIAIKGAQDEAANTTRFIVVERDNAATSLSRADQEPLGLLKTSLAFEVGHTPGALYKVLSLFAAAGLNLTKLESRPIPERTWEYRFYLDFDGDVNDSPVIDALAKARSVVTKLNIFGSYPSARDL